MLRSVSGRAATANWWAVVRAVPAASVARVRASLTARSAWTWASPGSASALVRNSLNTVFARSTARSLAPIAARTAVLAWTTANSPYCFTVWVGVMPTPSRRSGWWGLRGGERSAGGGRAVLSDIRLVELQQNGLVPLGQGLVGSDRRHGVRAAGTPVEDPRLLVERLGRDLQAPGDRREDLRGRLAQTPLHLGQVRVADPGGASQLAQGDPGGTALLADEVAHLRADRRDAGRLGDPATDPATLPATRSTFSRTVVTCSRTNSPGVCMCTTLTRGASSCKRSS